MRSRRGSPLDELFFGWLISPLERRWDLDFDLPMLRVMFTTPFEHYVPNDVNRAIDGKALREEFLYKAPVKSSVWEVDGWLALDCSVLEMMIALADRTAYKTGDQMPDWFDTFIRNLGLSERKTVPQIQRVLARLNNRRYNADGSQGGLFPLSHPLEDQREVELWYQMSAYVIEHYEGGDI